MSEDFIAPQAIVTPEGVTYHPWSNGYAVGFRAVHRDGRTEHIFLNPSSDTGEIDGQPNVFVYHDTTGDPDEALEGNTGSVCYVDMFVAERALGRGTEE